MTIAPEESMLDQVLVEDEESRAVIDPQEIQNAIVRHLRKGHEQAIGLSEKTKNRWWNYNAMRSGTWQGDDPSDPLVKLGVYVRVLAKHIRILKAAMQGRLIPDPAAMDVVAVAPRWEGLEEYCQAVEAWLRDMLKSMSPEASFGFIDLLDRMLDDWIALGTATAIVTHEAYEIADGPGVDEGPVVQYISPFNVHPWRTAVNEISQTAVTIYDPLDAEALKTGEYLNIERVLEECTASDLPMIDPDVHPGRLTNAEGRRRETVQPSDTNESLPESYRRYYYFGPFPIKAIYELMPDKKGATADDAMILAAEAVGFDPAPFDGWWDIEWIGDVLVQCRPYPMDQPRGRSPLVLHPFSARNGQVWGEGLYDLVRQDERLLNTFMRNALTISALVARPPFTYAKSLVDQAWLQKQGGELKLFPNQAIPLTNELALQFPLIRTVDVNSQAIPLQLEMADRMEGSMREQTGITSAVEGQDRSKTATQAANNLQQSIQIIDYYAGRGEQRILRDLCERLYVVGCQALKVAGMSRTIPMSFEQSRLSTVQLQPEMLRDLSLIDIQIVGQASPSGKVQMLNAIKEFAAQFIPTGIVDVNKVAKLWARMVGIRGADDLMVNKAQMSQQAYLQNLMAAFGQSGMQFAPPGLIEAAMGLPPGMAGGGIAGVMPGAPDGGGMQGPMAAFGAGGGQQFGGPGAGFEPAAPQG